MTETIWTEPYSVNTLVLDHGKRLGLFGLTRLLQDVAWIHARHLGHGYEAMIERDTIWVLTRQMVRMRAWPAWGEALTLRTWVRPISGPLALRDTQIVAEDGRVLGEATACWLTLDVNTRRPMKLALGEATRVCHTGGTLDLDPPRIAALDGAETALRLEARTGDLDLNGHVNNACYAQWVLDALPPDLPLHTPVAAYEVCFLAECHPGDSVALERAPLDPAPDGGMRVQVQGRRDGDGKPLFAARLTCAPAPVSPG